MERTKISSTVFVLLATALIGVICDLALYWTDYSFFTPVVNVLLLIIVGVTYLNERFVKKHRFRKKTLLIVSIFFFLSISTIIVDAFFPPPNLWLLDKMDGFTTGNSYAGSDKVIVLNLDEGFMTTVNYRTGETLSSKLIYANILRPLAMEQPKVIAFSEEFSESLEGDTVFADALTDISEARVVLDTPFKTTSTGISSRVSLSENSLTENPRKSSNENVGVFRYLVVDTPYWRYLLDNMIFNVWGLFRTPERSLLISLPLQSYIQGESYHYEVVYDKLKLYKEPKSVGEKRETIPVDIRGHTYIRLPNNEFKSYDFSEVFDFDSSPYTDTDLSSNDVKIGINEKYKYILKDSYIIIAPNKGSKYDGISRTGRTDKQAMFEAFALSSLIDGQYIKLTPFYSRIILMTITGLFCFIILYSIRRWFMILILETGLIILIIGSSGISLYFSDYWMPVHLLLAGMIYSAIIYVYMRKTGIITRVNLEGGNDLDEMEID